MDKISSVFCGTAFHVPERHVLEVLKDALIVVGAANGKIERVLLPTHNDYNATKEEAAAAGKLVVLRQGQFLIPGLIDLHVHAPQWPQTGKALHLPLNEWLANNTFPLEAKYEDLAFADKMYNSLVEALLANGTTTVAYYGSIHVEASVHLAKVCLQKGQRAIIGRVAMDLPGECPDFYRDESPAQSIAKSAAFIEEIKALKGNTDSLVHPCVIPRFIPTCSDEALRGLSELARQHNCYIQTHCSEGDWEHLHVLNRYKKRDTIALDDLGLITRHTILAHSVFMSTEDMDVVVKRGAAVAHCPISNMFFANAVFPLKKALDMNVHVGMGTDLAGGHSPSILDNCRYAIAASRALEDGVDPNKIASERTTWKDARIDHIEAFWLATTQGGVALDLPVGKFVPGYAFDSLVVDVNARGSNIKVFEEEDSLEDIFQKIVYHTTPANIIQTRVNGRLVHEL